MYFLFACNPPSTPPPPLPPPPRPPLPPPAAPPDTPQIREWTAGGAAPRDGRHGPQNKPIYFPSSPRLHLRAHQRAPIEPLKPLFPNMKEGNQNRDRKKGEDPEERRLICLFWGITQKGAHFPRGAPRPVCPLEV